MEQAYLLYLCSSMSQEYLIHLRNNRDYSIPISFNYWFFFYYTSACVTGKFIHIAITFFLYIARSPPLRNGVSYQTLHIQERVWCLIILFSLPSIIAQGINYWCTILSLPFFFFSLFLFLGWNNTLRQSSQWIDASSNHLLSKSSWTVSST